MEVKMSREDMQAGVELLSEVLHGLGYRPPFKMRSPATLFKQCVGEWPEGWSDAELQWAMDAMN